MGATILLTGAPGIGKTTLIRRLLPQLPGPAGGFYTEEIRERNERVGFRLVTLAGASATMAHVDIGGRFRVGRYGVDVRTLDRVGVAALRQAVAAGQIVVVDEIGKMELFSTAFRAAVVEAVASASPVLGTIMLRSHPWADTLKGGPNVQVLTVTRENRDALADEVLTRLHACLHSQRSRIG